MEEQYQRGKGVPTVPIYGSVPAQQMHKELALYEAILTHKLKAIHHL